MLNTRHNASDASSRLVEFLDGDETASLTMEAPAKLGAPSAPKRYELPTDWEQHKVTIRQLYLDENKPLKEVMAIMGRDHGHFGSIKHYKNKLKEWKFDTKYKRHQSSRQRNHKRPRRQSAVADRSLAAPANDYHFQAPEIERAANHQFQIADATCADNRLLQAASAGSAEAHLLEAPEARGTVNQIFQPADVGYADYQHVQAASTGYAVNHPSQAAGAGYAVNYPSQAADAGHAVDYTFQAADARRAVNCFFRAPGVEDAEDQHSKAADTGSTNAQNTTRQASAENEGDWQLSFPRRHSFHLSHAVGVRSGRSATPPISIAERIFSLAQKHVETSFTYGFWKVDSSNVCTSMTCAKEDMELPEAYFDLVRSAVLLFQQGSIIEGKNIVSKAFALVKPILRSGNVRALNFFWTSLVYLVQFGHAPIVVILIGHIHKMAETVLHPEHPIVQMFKLLTHTDMLELETLVHNTWQITADALQKQLPKLHPEYVRHQCDLTFRIYGMKDAATAERRLRQLLKYCEKAAQTPELSRMTVLNALGYNFTNSKDWVQAVNTGHELEQRARLAQDIDTDLLVYQIGGMEIQARAYNELKLTMPAVACLERATPLIAKHWGSNDPWRIELMILQQNWLRENGKIKAADDLKAEISSIAERIDTD